jgi:hypothetical protein
MHVGWSFWAKIQWPSNHILQELQVPEDVLNPDMKVFPFHQITKNLNWSYICFQVRRSLTKPDHIFSGKTILTKPDQIQQFEYLKCLGLYLFIKLPMKWFTCGSEILLPSFVETVGKHYRRSPKIVKTDLSYGPSRGHKNRSHPLYYLGGFIVVPDK